MKTWYISIWLSLFLLVGCAGEVRNAALPQATPFMKVSDSTSLFLESSESIPAPAEPQAARWRVVKINLGLLLDESGQAREMGEFTINLFPDVTYTGVVEEVTPEGDGYSWSGHLKDVEFSAFFMVYTSGVFIAHFSSPLGVYEVSIARDDLYRIIQIDQQKLPGGEG